MHSFVYTNIYKIVLVLVGKAEGMLKNSKEIFESIFNGHKKTVIIYS